MTDSSGATEEDQAIRGVEPWRVASSGLRAVREPEYVAVEQPVHVHIKDVGSYTLMCTPGDRIALAVGFAFSERIIGGRKDISLVQECLDDPGTILIELVDSSVCGSRDDVERFLSNTPSVGETLHVPIALLLDVVEAMHTRQSIFAQTGGTHATGIFSADGDLIAFAEDIGRHNALDKAIGQCVLERRSMAGCGVALSGRVSFELVSKAARAGIELIAAVSAPSSLAIEVAERCNITLCGFVRDDRATVYSQPNRILDLER